MIADRDGIVLNGSKMPEGLEPTSRLDVALAVSSGFFYSDMCCVFLLFFLPVCPPPEVCG